MGVCYFEDRIARRAKMLKKMEEGFCEVVQSRDGTGTQRNW